MIYSGLTETQLSGMGTALTQGGSGLLHIAIQVMPYAIALTVIFIIFRIVKQWSKLRVDDSGYKKPRYRGEYRKFTNQWYKDISRGTRRKHYFDKDYEF